MKKYLKPQMEITQLQVMHSILADSSLKVYDKEKNPTEALSKKANQSQQYAGRNNFSWKEN